MDITTVDDKMRWRLETPSHAEWERARSIRPVNVASSLILAPVLERSKAFSET